MDHPAVKTRPGRTGGSSPPLAGHHSTRSRILRTRLTAEERARTRRHHAGQGDASSCQATFCSIWAETVLDPGPPEGVRRNPPLFSCAARFVHAPCTQPVLTTIRL